MLRKLAVSALISISLVQPISAQEPNISDVNQVQSEVKVQNAQTYDHKLVAKLMREYSVLLKNVERYSNQSKNLKSEANDVVNNAKRKSANARAASNALILLGTAALSVDAEVNGYSRAADDIAITGIELAIVNDDAHRYSGDRKVNKAMNEAALKRSKANGIDQNLMEWRLNLDKLQSEIDAIRDEVLLEVAAMCVNIDGFVESFSNVTDIAFDERGAIAVITVEINNKTYDVTLMQLEQFVKDEYQSIVDKREADHKAIVEVIELAETDKAAAQDKIDAWDKDLNGWLKLNSMVPWSKNNDRRKEVDKAKKDYYSSYETAADANKRRKLAEKSLKEAKAIQKSIRMMDKTQLQEVIQKIKQL